MVLVTAEWASRTSFLFCSIYSHTLNGSRSNLKKENHMIKINAKYGVALVLRLASEPCQKYLLMRKSLTLSFIRPFLRYIQGSLLDMWRLLPMINKETIKTPSHSAHQRGHVEG